MAIRGFPYRRRRSVPRLYRLFTAANFGGNGYNGLDPRYIGAWNVMLGDDFDDPNYYSYDRTITEFAIAPDLNRPFGVLNGARQVGYDQDAALINVDRFIPSVATDVGDDIMDGFTAAFAARSELVRKHCGYDGYIYIGLPPLGYDQATIADMIRPMVQCGFTRVGVDVGANVAYTDARNQGVLAFESGLRAYGLRPALEGAPLHLPRLEAWYTAARDLIVGHNTESPSTAEFVLAQANGVKPGDPAIGASEWIVVMSGAVPVAKRVPEARRFRAMGASVSLETYGIPAADLRRLRSEFGP